MGVLGYNRRAKTLQNKDKNMQISTTEKSSRAIRLVARNDEGEVGHVYLYLIYNDLHTEPYGLFEDIQVVESVRGQGVGGQLVQALIAEARKQGCYKIVANSRGHRTEIHDWYARLGFEDYGKEFRLNL